MAKVLACDLDGTLFYPKQIGRCISKKNVRFLQKWIDEGNRVVFISSRSYEFTSKLLDEVKRPIDFVNYNGSQIRIDGKLVRDVAVPHAEMEEFIKKVDEKYHPLAYFISTKNYPCVIRDNGRANKLFVAIYHIYYWFQFKYREPYIMDNDLFDKELANEGSYKVMTFFGLANNKAKVAKEINKELRENFPNVESSWLWVVNEITPQNCNKGNGLEFYCQNLGIDANDVYVVGDSGNDITMFNKFHKNSYCMAHAYPSVKKYASHIISRVYKLEHLVLKGEKQ